MTEQLGGARAGEVAVRFRSDSTAEDTVDYREICGPLYTQSPGNDLDQIETIRNADVLAHWLAGEGVSFDLRAGLAKAACPVVTGMTWW